MSNSKILFLRNLGNLFNQSIRESMKIRNEKLFRNLRINQEILRR